MHKFYILYVKCSIGIYYLKQSKILMHASHLIKLRNLPSVLSEFRLHQPIANRFPYNIFFHLSMSAKASFCKKKYMYRL